MKRNKLLVLRYIFVVVQQSNFNVRHGMHSAVQEQ